MNKRQNKKHSKKHSVKKKNLTNKVLNEKFPDTPEPKSDIPKNEHTYVANENDSRDFYIEYLRNFSLDEDFVNEAANVLIAIESRDGLESLNMILSTGLTNLDVYPVDGTETAEEKRERLSRRNESVLSKSISEYELNVNFEAGKDEEY